LLRQSQSESLTLGEFRELYLSERRQGRSSARRFRKSQKPVSEATLLLHDMTLKYLIGWFGPDRAINSLEPDELSDWIEALAAGELNHLRRWRGRRDGPPSDETLRKQVRLAKGIFSWAAQRGYIPNNPMADFAAPGRPSQPNYYVTRDDLAALCQASDSRPWATLCNLCRLAGLRRGEALALPWQGEATDQQGVVREVGVDWDNQRLLLVSPKTRAFRQVPIEPALYERLCDDWQYASRVDDLIAPARFSNLVRVAKDNARAAGLEPWAKPYQAMRSSWENDLKQAGVPEATFASWLGHSMIVSRMHYTAPTDAEFERITSGGSA
jgi:integrase